MRMRSLALAAVALPLVLAAAQARPCHHGLLRQQRERLYAALAAGTYANDSVEVRVEAGTYWLNKDLRFDNIFGQRLYLKGGYGSFGGDCNLRIWNATRTIIRAAYVSGFDVELYSAYRVELKT